MQEEVMEKGRSSSAVSAAAAKPAGADQRKVDVQSRYNRYGRKKENGGSKQTDQTKSVNNAGRRGGPHKYRDWVDRRPQPRAELVQQSPYTESEEVKELEPASNAQRGSRKGNLNHLLNFTFNPRETQRLDLPVGRKRRTSTRFYNKEQFLQANCQFVVCESGDYKIHTADPDKLVDWNLIEQVRVFDHEVLNCPICLFPPVAARITRCGHVYCWSCVLHYLSLDDSKWRKCPICYEAVHRFDLKSVRVMPTHAYQTGETLTLRLMRKTRGSTVISPALSAATHDQRLVTMDATEVESCYSKLLVATSSHVTEKIINVEKQQLLKQRSEHEQDSLESSFITLALEELAKRQELLEMGRTYQTPPARPGYQTLLASPVDELVESVGKVNLAPKRAEKKLIVYACAFSEEELDVPLEGATSTDFPPLPIRGATANDVAVDDVIPLDDEGTSGDGSVVPIDDCQTLDEVLDLPSPTMDEVLDLPSPLEERSSSPTARNKDYFYFYQADDGQQIYLHSVNARCLMAEYGGLDKCPRVITGRVEALEPVSMTEELRRRLRYLNHLPLTCQFKFAQIQMKPPLISNKTLTAFEGEFAELRNQRKRKLRDEKRVAKQQDRQDVLKSQLHTFKTTTIVQSAGYQPESPPRAQPANQRPEPVEERRGSVTSEGRGSVASQIDDGPSIPSFAQMLRLPSSAPPPVWPRAAPAPFAAATRTNVESDDDGPAVPSYQTAFSDAIQSALDTMVTDTMVTDTMITDTMVTEPQQQKVKKNKQKKKMLFTTTMNRASAL